MARTVAPGVVTGEPIDGSVASAVTLGALAVDGRPGDDETAAAAARERYRSQPMTDLIPDAELAGFLATDERVLAARSHATLERRQPVGAKPLASGLRGRLIVTSSRVLLVGRTTLSFDLRDITETVMGGDYLLVVMRDGLGFAIDVPLPRLLRVEIAAARTAARPVDAVP
jgi:hypothetical protein